MTRPSRRTRVPSDQVAQSDDRTEAAQAEMAATTQRILDTAARVEAAIPEEVLPEWDDTSTVRHIQEMRDQLAKEPIDVTSSWRPLSIVFDGRGGFTLTAFDGTELYVPPGCDVKVNAAGRGNVQLSIGAVEMMIQRKDNPDLIDALRRAGLCPELVTRLEDERDRFASMRLPTTDQDSE